MRKSLKKFAPFKLFFAFETPFSGTWFMIKFRTIW